MAGGDLGALHAGWCGYRIAPDGLIYPPDHKQGWRPADVRSIYWHHQMSRTHRAQVNSDKNKTRLPHKITLTVEIDENGVVSLINDNNVVAR